MSILTSVCAGGIGWLVGRTESAAKVAKMKQETAQLYLQNVEDAIQLWKNIAKDLETQVVNLTSKCQELTQEIEDLRKENKTLQLAYEKLEQAINSKVN